mmetsp:Transcript_21753/g.71956  ORF Transcript_21753/g.71956 Transcript_21753/m.71956 type:complete len:205 (+) Transcript_21753:221-835(+)
MYLADVGEAGANEDKIDGEQGRGWLLPLPVLSPALCRGGEAGLCESFSGQYDNDAGASSRAAELRGCRDLGCGERDLEEDAAARASQDGGGGDLGDSQGADVWGAATCRRRQPLCHGTSPLRAEPERCRLRQGVLELEGGALPAEDCSQQEGSGQGATEGSEEEDGAGERDILGEPSACERRARLLVLPHGANCEGALHWLPAV